MKPKSPSHENDFSPYKPSEKEQKLHDTLLKHHDYWRKQRGLIAEGKEQAFMTAIELTIKILSENQKNRPTLLSDLDDMIGTIRSMEYKANEDIECSNDDYNMGRSRGRSMAYGHCADLLTELIINYNRSEIK